MSWLGGRHCLHLQAHSDVHIGLCNVWALSFVSLLTWELCTIDDQSQDTATWTYSFHHQVCLLMGQFHNIVSTLSACIGPMMLIQGGSNSCSVSMFSMSTVSTSCFLCSGSSHQFILTTSFLYTITCHQRSSQRSRMRSWCWGVLLSDGITL